MAHQTELARSLDDSAAIADCELLVLPVHERIDPEHWWELARTLQDDGRWIRHTLFDLTEVHTQSKATVKLDQFQAPGHKRYLFW